jgi:uncharacterized protein VirK/YbjX
VITDLSEVVRFLRPTHNPLLEREQRECPAIREFILRPYVNQHWGLRRRLREIANHYRLVRNRVPFFDLLNTESRDLTQFDVDGTALRVVMDRPRWMRREGQIGISLFHGTERIYTAMLHLSGTPDDMQLVVGNLQGDGRDRLALYKSLTKLMHGMRPRDFLIHIVRMLAAELNCREVLGISNAAHRSAHWLSMALKVSTYDDMWLEHGGQRHFNSGFFTMPSGLRKRADEDIPANKRGIYRRRHQLLEELQLTLRERVAAAQPQTVSINVRELRRTARSVTAPSAA